MRAKVMVVLFIIILLLIAVYAAAVIFGSPRAEAPTNGFRGPTGAPHMNGPSAPPR